MHASPNLHASPTSILTHRNLPAINQRPTPRVGADFGRCHRPCSTVRTVELAGPCSLVHPTRRPNSFERFMPAPMVVWLVGWLVGWLFGWLVGLLFGWSVVFCCWLIGREVLSLVGVSGSWLVYWLVFYLVGCIAGWLFVWMVGCVFDCMVC